MVLMVLIITGAKVEDDIRDIKLKNKDIKDKLTFIEEKLSKPELTFFGTEYFPNDNGKLFLQLVIDEVVSNTDDCIVNLYNTSLQPIIRNQMMNKTGFDGLYYYNFIVPHDLGIHMATAYCFIGILSDDINASTLGIVNGTLESGDVTSLFLVDSIKLQIKEFNQTVNKSELVFDVNFSFPDLSFFSTNAFTLNITSDVVFDNNDFLEVFVKNFTGDSFVKVNMTLNGLNQNNFITSVRNLSDFIQDDSIMLRFSDFNKTLSVGESVSVDPLFKGFWRFEESNGSIAIDSTGNGNTGNIIEAVYVSSYGLNETGNFSLDFDGSNDYVNIDGSNDDFLYGNGTHDFPFSIGAWINMTDATGFRVVTKRENNLEIEWGFFTDSNDQLNFQLQDDINNNRQARRTNAITSLEGKWVHVVGTYDGSGSSAGINLYINGVNSDVADDNSGSYVAMQDEDINVTIGALNIFSTANGLIDEVFIVSKELDQTEILDIMNNGVTLNFSSGDTEQFNIAEFDQILLSIRHNGTPTQLASQEIHVSEGLYNDTQTIKNNSIMLVAPALLTGTDLNINLFGFLIFLWVSLVVIGIWKLPILSILAGLFGIVLGLFLIQTSLGIALTFIAVNLIIMIFVFISTKK